MSDVTIMFSARYVEFIRDRVIDNWELCVKSVESHKRIDARRGISSAEELPPVEQIWWLEAEESLAEAEVMRDQALDWDEDDGLVTLSAAPRALEHFVADAIYVTAPTAPADQMVLSDELFAWVDLIRLLGDLGEQVRDARVGEEV